ncbi:DUF2235 domain-containing protein [Chryseobacterium sp. ERMR1:04]|uniref:phospholipase effector Tle1 domain-containing protein n=1 Tax=Chryseobacterium sp. ERMR1:04 TaxID=1705393 RepID=UPI0006C8D696|nr:DUF2235 domain-containing protein [Chryseobacterium sp. ERMR1:04]KPH12911.1 hypothetical protein AMQ68_14770 [Chryseobacterium sp. ERMR1:04]
MSIEYFVEGKVITKVKGDYSVFSKEDITHNTGISLEQSGKENGVSYGKAKNIDPNNKPVNLLEVSLNLFFDGTQNNKTNSDLGKDYKESNHDDDSYTNDYSNIARGYDAVDPAAENQVSYYIEGIGTEDGKGEMHLFGNVPNKGILFGTGSRGVIAKVLKGCIKGAEALKKYAGKDIHLKVNVFGFSRGATAARHFLHISNTSAKVVENKFGIYALSPQHQDSLIDAVRIKAHTPLTDKHGYFGACLAYWEVIPQKITFNFAGLYDTVASYGSEHRPKEIGGIPIIPGDTEQLGLTAIKEAHFTLQITADDEFRDNFDLTNIDSCGVKGLQFILPGVHSDIGGCYVNKNEEKVDLYEEEGSGEKCLEFRRIIIEEGWYKPEEIFIERLSPHRNGVDARHILKGIRKPYNTYDKISFNAMFHYSQGCGVKYDNDLAGRHKITDPFLLEIRDQLLHYMNACTLLRNTYIEEYNRSNDSGDYLTQLNALHYESFVDLEKLKILRNQYLHWSASATKIGYGPRIGKVTSGKERTRNIQNG